jgi:hypothetical protein
MMNRNASRSSAFSSLQPPKMSFDQKNALIGLSAWVESQRGYKSAWDYLY